MKRLLPALALAIGLATAAPLVGSTASAQALNNPPVWRAEIQLNISNVRYADSDSSVKVELNNQNSTWLDYPRNDFERGTQYRYDLDLSGVSRLRDITKVKISKTGGDGLCLASFNLRINNRSLLLRSFGGEADHCRWLDNEDGHTRSFELGLDALSPHFDSYEQPSPPTRISRSEIESRVAGMVGNYMHGTRLYWGHLHGRGVEASRKDDRTLAIDLDLAYKVDVWADPEVDVNFDLRFSCNAGQISVATRNVDINVDAGLVADVLTGGLSEFLEGYVSRRIQAAWRNFSYTTDLGAPICPTITVDPSGDVVFSLG